MCSSNEGNLNYATKVAKMLLSSACEEQRSVERFLWAKGRNSSEIVVVVVVVVAFYDTF